MNVEKVKALEEAYKVFMQAPSKSLLKKYLCSCIFETLKMKTTKIGATLMDCVQSGFANPDSSVGIYASDPEAYTVFSDIFDPIIEEYHMGFSPSDTQPALNFGDLKQIGNVDPGGNFVVSTRVRCGRSVEGYPFNPMMTKEQYLELECKVSQALLCLGGELKGEYFPLEGMNKDIQKKLQEDHFLFHEGDRFLEAANSNRFWPQGRGIFHNQEKTFLVWVNEEDHLRIISMQTGGNLGQVYGRFVCGVNEIGKKVHFARSDRLGYLSFCPTNLGTAIRASVHIKVPKLGAKQEQFQELAKKFNLQIRGTRGEHTDVEGGVYDISNKRRLGLTEFEALKEMHDGILAIIEEEKKLT